MVGDPGEDLRVFVGGVIVGDGMDDLPPGVTVDTGGPTPAASGTFRPERVMNALISVESSGNPAASRVRAFRASA